MPHGRCWGRDPGDCCGVLSEEVDPAPQLRLAPILIDALLRDFQGLQDSEISEESDDDMGMRSPTTNSSAWRVWHPKITRQGRRVKDFSFCFFLLILVIFGSPYLFGQTRFSTTLTYKFKS
jgi:hypothetical protein